MAPPLGIRNVVEIYLYMVEPGLNKEGWKIAIAGIWFFS